MAAVSSRKQRKALVKKVSNSLAKHTEGLDSFEAQKRYLKTKQALKVRFALDKRGIADKAKRQRIQRILQKTIDRAAMIAKLTADQGSAEYFRRTSKDVRFQQYRAELTEALGSKRQASIFIAKMFFTPVKLKPEK